MQFNLAIAALTALVLGGCWGEKSTLLPETTKLVDSVPRVNNSPKSPCWQQEQIAAQNSYLDSVKNGKETAYLPPCKVEQKVAAK